LKGFCNQRQAIGDFPQVRNFPKIFPDSKVED
jgi:hypothetical protein